MVRAASGNVAKAAPQRSKAGEREFFVFFQIDLGGAEDGKTVAGQGSGRRALSVGLSALFLPVTAFRMSFRDMGIPPLVQ